MRSGSDPDHPQINPKPPDSMREKLFELDPLSDPDQPSITPRSTPNHQIQGGKNFRVGPAIRSGSDLDYPQTNPKAPDSMREELGELNPISDLHQTSIRPRSDLDHPQINPQPPDSMRDGFFEPDPKSDPDQTSITPRSTPNHQIQRRTNFRAGSKIRSRLDLDQPSTTRFNAGLFLKSDPKAGTRKRAMPRPNTDRGATPRGEGKARRRAPTGARHRAGRERRDAAPQRGRGTARAGKDATPRPHRGAASRGVPKLKAGHQAYAAPYGAALHAC